MRLIVCRAGIVSIATLVVIWQTYAARSFLIVFLQFGLGLVSSFNSNCGFYSGKDSRPNGDGRSRRGGCFVMTLYRSQKI